MLSGLVTQSVQNSICFKSQKSSVLQLSGEKIDCFSENAMFSFLSDGSFFGLECVTKILSHFWVVGKFISFN